MGQQELIEGRENSERHREKYGLKEEGQQLREGLIDVALVSEVDAEHLGQTIDKRKYKRDDQIGIILHVSDEHLVDAGGQQDYRVQDVIVGVIVEKHLKVYVAVDGLLNKMDFVVRHVVRVFVNLVRIYFLFFIAASLLTII